MGARPPLANVAISTGTMAAAAPSAEMVIGSLPCITRLPTTVPMAMTTLPPSDRRHDRTDVRHARGQVGQEDEHHPQQCDQAAHNQQ